MQNEPPVSRGERAGQPIRGRPTAGKRDECSRYVICPRCDDPFTEPFLPASVSYHVVRTHIWEGRGACRVVVTVHPDGRTEAEVIPSRLSLEDALYEYVDWVFTAR